MGKSIKNTTLMGMLIISMLSLSACGQKVADEEQYRLYKKILQES